MLRDFGYGLAEVGKKGPETNDFDSSEAYAVACLGVTSLDWERLGMAALEELSFEIARKAFQRRENIVFLNLIDHLQVKCHKTVQMLRFKICWSYVYIKSALTQSGPHTTFN